MITFELWDRGIPWDGWTRRGGAVAVLVSCLCLPAVLGCGPERARPRNVVVILVDALRRDHLGVYGHPGRTTPNIDRLARRSLLYENAYSTSTWTVPSIASLFTGTLPVVHRINRPPERRFAFSVLDESYVLASEVFKKSGFTTGMITTIGWVSDQANYDQGVDDFIRTERLDALLVSHAQEFIREHREERFHLYLHFVDLHDYYDPARIFAEGYQDQIDPGSELLSLRELTADESYLRLGRELGRPGRLSARDLGWLRQVYDRELRMTDQYVSLLVEQLRKEGLLEKTLIVITADHGEQFLEHGTLTHGGDGFYNEVLGIPMIIAGPGHYRGLTRISTPVSLIDLYPTLFDLLGVSANGPYQGESVVEDSGEDRAVFATNGRTWKVINRRWSYIVGPKGREELYDLDQDPGETRNLAGDAAVESVRSDLRRRLRVKRGECLAHEYVMQVRDPAAAEMTNEEREALKALGYLD